TKSGGRTDILALSNPARRPIMGGRSTDRFTEGGGGDVGATRGVRLSTKLFRVRSAVGVGRLNFEILEPRRLLAVHVWTGAVDGNWSNPANWQGGAPAAGESALEIEFGADAVRQTSVNDLPDLTITALRL